MVETTLQFSEASISHLAAAMQRAQDEPGKSGEDVVKWAGHKVAGSLSAATKIAPKLRRIVKNPDKRYKTDRRRAPFGVMMYKGGQQVFKPIFRSGEYGKIRFYDKKSASWFERHGPDGNTWQKVASGPDIANPEIIVPGIKTDKRRRIGRRGLAKKSWTGIKNRVNSGGTVSVGQFQASNVGNVTHRRAEGAFELRMRNQLRYASDAFTVKTRPVEDVLFRAADGMIHQIDKRVEKALKKSGLK